MPPMDAVGWLKLPVVFKLPPNNEPPSAPPDIAVGAPELACPTDPPIPLPAAIDPPSPNPNDPPVPNAGFEVPAAVPTVPVVPPIPVVAAPKAPEPVARVPKFNPDPAGPNPIAGWDLNGVLN